jgi:hypothetical protein
VLVFSSSFNVQVFFCNYSAQGFIPGWLGEYCVILGTHLFGLLNFSQAGLELVAAVELVAVEQPTCFLSLMWHGESFCGLGVQGVKVWFSLVLYFCQV